MTESDATRVDDPASDPALAARLRSPRMFLHEIAGAIFVVIGIILLERMPVTYPRSALLFAMPVFAMLIGGSVILALRRRRAGSRALDLLILGRIGVVLLFVFSVHFLLKSFIYVINPTVWDAKLLQLDQVIHFGFDPGRFFTTLFGEPWLLRFFDVVYSNVYFFAVLIYPSILLTIPPPRRRLAFGSAFTLLWVIGVALYLAFPSWGPAFVVPADFTEVMRSMPSTLRVQRVLSYEIFSLVQNPTGDRIVRYGSVAAFPSLHIAVVTLFALASRSISRGWFRWNVALVVVMVLGSVVTGYHYLIDAYGGLFIGWGTWWAGRRMFERGAALEYTHRAPSEPPGPRSEE